MEQSHPQFEAFAKKGYGYAFFPEITKGGFVVGGARGQGVVFEKGQHIGYADLTQMSVGFQAGYQDYSQLIVFENQTAMDKFKRNEIDFGANASAVVADTGRPWAPSSSTVWRFSSGPSGVRWLRRPLAASRSRIYRSDQSVAAACLAALAGTAAGNAP